MKDANAPPRGKAFGVFRLSHVATYQPATVACRSCGGTQPFEGPCGTCRGAGSHAPRKPLPPVTVLRVPGEWLDRTEAEKIRRSFDWRLFAHVGIVDRAR